MSFTSIGTSGFGRDALNEIDVLPPNAVIFVARSTSFGSTGWLNRSSNACFGSRCVAPSPGEKCTTRGRAVVNENE